MEDVCDCLQKHLAQDYIMKESYLLQRSGSVPDSLRHHISNLKTTSEIPLLTTNRGPIKIYQNHWKANATTTKWVNTRFKCAKQTFGNHVAIGSFDPPWESLSPYKMLEHKKKAFFEWSPPRDILQIYSDIIYIYICICVFFCILSDMVWDSMWHSFWHSIWQLTSILASFARDIDIIQLREGLNEDGIAWLKGSFCKKTSTA